MANTSRNQPQGAHSKANDGADALMKLQYNFEKNQKLIIGIVAAIIILVGGYFGYKYYIQKPNEEKAENAIFRTQQWFQMDSMNLVLNGDGPNGGALSVIKKYSGTPAANLAHYYAGIAYLKTGKSQEAIKQLEKFDGKGTVLQYIAYGSIGSAYMDMNNTAKAIEYYKKAATGNDKDNFTNPYYLKMAGFASEKSGKTKDAISFYKEIKEKYPRSAEARDIDKYLARLGDISEN